MSRIYVSSTFADLSGTRAAVVQTLRELGHGVVAMEDYLASDERPLDRCLADVATCDIYVGILAWRYGYVPPRQEKSITELEFREADRLDKPTLFFLLHEDAPWPRSMIDRDPRPIETFRAEVSRDLLVSFFHDADELRTRVGTAVTTLEQKRSTPAVGTDFLRTPNLGLQVLQDGRRAPLLRADHGRILVPLKRAPFELRVPDVGEDGHVQIAASYDEAVFAPAEQDTPLEDVPFLRPGTGMADTGYGSGELVLTDEGHMFLNMGGRLVPDEHGGGVVLFSTITERYGKPMPWGRTVHAVVYLDRHDSWRVSRYNTERLILRF